MNKAFELLCEDHKKVKKVIENLQATRASSMIKREKLFTLLKKELQRHEQIEEAVVYPVFEEKKDIKDLTLEAYEEHHIVDVLIEELEDLGFNDENWKAKLTVLQENLLHHILEEETKLFPQASKILKQKELNTMCAEIEHIKVYGIENHKY